jgi:arabinogalactan oligomer/maltooligosaccharide transport system substrate-binding protein
MKTKLLERAFALLSFVLALALAVPAAAQKELVVWHGYRGGEKAAFEKVIEGFNKANAGKIKVTSLAVPFDAFADKVTAAVPRGKGPDVFI